METEPQFDDCFISCDGNKYSTSRESKFIGEFIEFDDAIESINILQDSDHFYYDIWFINDHGNIDMIDSKGNIITQ